METAEKILARILKNVSVTHTVTSLAKETGLSRVGTWKILKKLEAERLVKLNSIGRSKTSTYTIELDFSNPLTEKTMELLLSKDAQDNKRWIDNFKDLEKEVNFLIIFGSILHTPKEANDIDVLIVADRKKMSTISEIILQLQKSMQKKIHSTTLTGSEFKEEMKKQNKIFIDAVNKGVVLFGHDSFIKAIRDAK